MEFIKDKYTAMSYLDKQKYIKILKDKFEILLSNKLNLLRVSAPIVVDPHTGLQDDLSGVEEKVEFKIKEDNKSLQIVQSLAKWKRFALKKYGFKSGSGLYTDMIAIRKDEFLDETHSLYVDQWDWEKVIDKENRNIDFLKEVVSKIAEALYETSVYLSGLENLKLPKLERDVYFISSEDLLGLFPTLNAKQREYEITKKYKTVFIYQIGDVLSNNTPHDFRAPDYDDWKLNGDLFFYHEVLDIALEISSMGIRVDNSSLQIQLEKSGANDKKMLPYHKSVINSELPLSIGGGIGQSRLCMLILGRAHIAEVQASYWTERVINDCKLKGIDIL